MENTSSKTAFENLSHNIIWLRKHHGYSKRKMAELLGIGLWSLNRLERFEIPPKLTVDILYWLHQQFRLLPHILLTQRLDAADGTDKKNSHSAASGTVGDQIQNL